MNSWPSNHNVKHIIDPLGRPTDTVDSDHYLLTCTYALFCKQNKMFVTEVTMGMAEGIIPVLYIIKTTIELYLHKIFNVKIGRFDPLFCSIFLAKHFLITDKF